MFLCRKSSSYDANDTKLMYSWIKNERWHKYELIVVEMELHCCVPHEWPRYAETPRSKVAHPCRGGRLLHHWTQEAERHPHAGKVCDVWGGVVRGRHSQQVLYTTTVSHGASTSPFLLPTLRILHPVGKGVWQVEEREVEVIVRLHWDSFLNIL